MSLDTPQQIFSAIKRSGSILIAPRKEFSVDGIATALALARIMEKTGKKADIVCDGFAAPKSLSFLPNHAAVKPELTHLQKFIISLDVSKIPIDELSYDIEGGKLRIAVTPKTGQYEPADVTTSASDFKYDLVITVDAPDFGALGGVFARHSDFFYHRPTINIDSDPGNEQYGNVNLVDISATSSAEIVYNLFKNSGQHFLDEDVATCLLAGMIAKTKSFKSAQVTPRTLEIAADLVAAGGRRAEIVQNLYRTRSIPTLKLWGRALARLKFDPNIKMAWAVLVRQDFVHAGAGEEYLADVIDDLIVNSPDAEIIGLIYEKKSADDKARAADICGLISSEKHADALGLVSALKPEGHRKMARVCFAGSDIAAAEKTILSAIYKSLGKMRGAMPAVKSADDPRFSIRPTAES